MKKENNHIDRLTPELMDRYARGDLSDREMHAVERLMLNSDFDAEAMEGRESVTEEAFNQDMSVLQNRLEKRITPSRSLATWWWSAAAVIVLAVSVGILLLNQNEPARLEIAENTVPQAMPEADQPATNSQQEQTDSEPEIAAGEVVAEADEQVSESGEENTPDRLALAESEAETSEARDIEDKPVAKQARKTENDETTGIATDQEERIRLSTVPRMAADSSPQTELPATKIVPPEQELIGVIKGEKLTLMTPSAGRPGEQLHGRVYDINGTPVQGASVTVKGLNQSLTTNLNGEFDLDLEEVEDDQVILSYIGMRSQGLEVSSKDSLFIMLEEDEEAELGEIVLEDETNPSNNIIYRGAGPAGGIANFKSYLEKNIQSNSDSSTNVKVLVIFHVNTDGSLTDFKVRKSPDDSYTSEAIRLIKEGPVWLPALQDGTPVRDRVRVRIAFN